MLSCEKCSGLCHYICSELPTYQIHMLRTRKRKYTCKLCSERDTIEYSKPEDVLNKYIANSHGLPVEVKTNPGVKSNRKQICLQEQGVQTDEIDIFSFVSEIKNSISNDMERLESQFVENIYKVFLGETTQRLENIEKQVSLLTTVSFRLAKNNVFCHNFVNTWNFDMKKVSFERTRGVVSQKFANFIKSGYSRKLLAIFHFLMGDTIHYFAW